MPDSGAQGYAFMDEAFTQHVERFLGIKRRKLTYEGTVRGFDGRSRQTISYILYVTLEVEGRSQQNIPFLLLKLKGHDIIVGKKWLAESEALLDCYTEKIIWKKDLPNEQSWNKTLVTDIETLRAKTSTKDQQDLQRRNSLWNAEEQTNLRKEKKEIVRKKEIPPTTPEVKICHISAPAFNDLAEKKDNVVFSTSIFEIDQILEHQQEKAVPRPEGISEEEWIKKKLPVQYHRFTEGFSKAASDVLPPHRKWDHKIELESENTLTYHPLYKQTPAELEATKKYILENLDKKFIEASQSPFAAPVLFVQKPNGGLRFCVDYRKLNQLTKKDRYPLPLIDETLQRLSKAKIFTKLNIQQAFHRIRMDPQSEELTTFRTRYGSYKYKVMPFGLTNGPATYQRYMNDILFEWLDEFCSAYVDDILIYSNSEEEHQEHVNKVLQRLQKAGLQADIDKSEFHVTTTKYLGFIISTDGIRVDPSKIEAIQKWQPPGTVKGVQSFLGFCNFYRRFIRNYGRVARPLSQLTRKDISFNWTEKCQEAFDTLKKALINAPVLKYFSYGRKHMLETDASDGVTAAVLSEQDPETEAWHPVAFYSKTMAPAECNYPIHDKELLAIIRAFEEWRAELIGEEDKLGVYSDHKALEYFMSTKQLSARQVRWAEYLSQFFFEVRFRAGKKNERADALTRREQDVGPQEKAMKEARYQILLKPAQIHPDVKCHGHDSQEVKPYNGRIKCNSKLKREGRVPVYEADMCSLYIFPPSLAKYVLLFESCGLSSRRQVTSHWVLVLRCFG
jgi:hypothetical protein